MNNDDTKKALSEIEKRVENIERHLVKPKANDSQTPAEIAQDKHQASLTSFQTVRNDGMNVSLNGMPMTNAQLDALLKDEKKQEN